MLYRGFTFRDESEKLGSELDVQDSPDIKGEPCLFETTEPGFRGPEPGEPDLKDAVFSLERARASSDKL